MPVMPSTVSTRLEAKRFAPNATFFAIVLLTWLMCGCGKQPGTAATGQREQEPIVVRIAPVEIRSVERGIDVTGTLYADDYAQIAAQVAGRVVEISKDLGDRVAPGELIARIDRTDYELALHQRQAAVQEALSRLGMDTMPGERFDLSTLPAVQRAEAQERNARARFERGRVLFESNPPLISQQEFADLETSLEVAQHNVTAELLNGRNLLAQARSREAEMRVAEQQLKDTEILAPLRTDAGTEYFVAERRVATGEFVTRGQAVFALVDVDPVRFRAEAPERYAGLIAVGQKVIVKLDAMVAPLEATVARISPRVDPQSRTFLFEAEIANPNGRIKPGSFGVGRVSTHVEPDVLMVPADAVTSFAGVKRVFSVRDGKAVEHRVQTGTVVEGLVEITEGGVPRDGVVVVSGASRLVNGSAVVVTQEHAGTTTGEKPTAVSSLLP